mmetsp:Transcript_36578/g.78979  ORF Transcript_36578/g.78979 Transcript_36578/m.78979 type:complete len:85 (-) Transcript_36578:112-366(-)
MKNNQDVYDAIAGEVPDELLDGWASKFPTKAADGVARNVLARRLDGTVSKAPTQAYKRVGPMRFLPPPSFAVPMRLRMKKTKRS